MTLETEVPKGGRGSEPPLRPDIEGLRGIAILVVVGFHAGWPGFGGGYVGVDVFFVLSGYLITWLLLREIEATGRVSFIRFYTRRARRLFPALSLMLLATMVASLIIYSPIEQRIASLTAGATNLYVSNMYFALSAMNYNGADAQLNPLLHTWSLAVEEQFYLVWPVLLFIIARPGKTTASARRRRIVAAMVVVAIASLALSIWLTRIRQPWAFFLSVTRAWEFAVGALTIMIVRANRKRHSVWAGWVGLLMLLFSVVTFSKESQFPGIIAVLPATATAALLWSGATDQTAGVSRLLTANWLQKIGRVSYSWYLWHWPVLIFVTAVTHDLGVIGRSACVFFSLVPAILSFRLIEDPIRRRRILKWRPAYSLAAGVSLCLAGAFVSVAWERLATHAATSPVQMRFMNAHSDRPIIYGNDCISDLYDRRLNECSFNNAGSSRTVVLFGDSHVAQWFPALDEISKQDGWKLVTFIKSACPVADIEYFYPVMGRRYTECSEWRGQVLQRINEIHPQMVIMASADGYAKHRLLDVSSWQAGIRQTLEKLSDSGARLVYLRDTPEPGFDVPSCLSRAVWHSGWLNQESCSLQRATALDDNLFRLEQDAGSGIKGVTFLDLTEQICPGAICQPETDQFVIYRDSNHLTASYATSLAATIRSKLSLSQINENQSLDRESGQRNTYRSDSEQRRAY